MFNRILGSALICSSAAILYTYQQRKKNFSSLFRNTAVVYASTDIPKAPLSSYRPSDWLHVHYAEQVYENTGGKVEPDWEVLRFYEDVKSGYFGVAYRNTKEKHIIFAHRGTEIFSAKDWSTNFNTIICRLNNQQVSAWDEFVKKIITEYGPSYAYSFAGHSLGGWLAEICLWKYQDEFFKGHYPAYQDAFSVTLDDPGGKELLEALQPRVEPSYKIDVDRLDRTNYVSRPNLVNTALGRKGATVYTLLPAIEPSWMMSHTLLFTAVMHSSEVLLKQFDQETGLPRMSYRVLDWPRVIWGKGLPSTDKQKGLLGCLAYMIKAYQKGEIDRGEYLGFYAYDNDRVNVPEQLPPASHFELQHGIHYRTIPFNPHSLPLRNMPQAAREFLEKLSYYPNRSKILAELTGRAIDLPLSELLNNYHINAREECVLNSSFSARAFRQAILLFLNEHPFLYQTSLSILREEYNLKQIKQGTEEAILKMLGNVGEQIQYSKTLIFSLSFNRGTARLYQFVKPTWDEIESLENEQQVLTKQLSILEALELTLETITLEGALKKKVSVSLQQHKEQLEVAKQSVNMLIYYLQGRLDEANQGIEQLIVKIKNLGENSDLDKNLLLNRAYNLKAKIATRMKNSELAKQYYQQAINVLPEDFLTASNYGGLLTDLGRFKKDPALYVEAYRCFQRVWPYIAQIKENEKAVVYSGIAYNYLLLARSLEEGDLQENDIPGMTFQQLRIQAQDLLKQAISIDPYSLNARLFLAILGYDEKEYLKALQEVDMALTLQPQHPTALMRKGLILDKLEQSEEALAVLHQSKSIMLATQANASWIAEVDKKIMEIEAGLQKKSKPRL